MASYSLWHYNYGCNFDDPLANGNRGVYYRPSTRDDSSTEPQLPAESIVVHVTTESIISKSTILTSTIATSLIPLLRDIDNHNDCLRDPSIAHHYLAVFLLLDATNQDSQHIDYYKLLPRRFDHIPLFWEADVLHQMEGSYFQQELVDKQKSHRRDYQHLRTHYSHLAQDHSFETYQWARICAETRNFRIQHDDNSFENVIVPMADMFNHRPQHQANAVWEYSDREGFMVRVTRSISPGEEITICYGKDKALGRLLLGYGFLDHYDNHVTSGIRLNKDERFERSTMRCRCFMGLDSRSNRSDPTAVGSTLNIKKRLFGTPYFPLPIDIPALVSQAMATNSSVLIVAMQQMWREYLENVIVCRETETAWVDLATEEQWEAITTIIEQRFAIERCSSVDNKDVEDDGSWSTIDEDEDSDGDDETRASSSVEGDDEHDEYDNPEGGDSRQPPLMIYGRGVYLTIEMHFSSALPTDDCGSTGDTSEFEFLDPLSFARFIAAQGRELLRLPYLDQGVPQGRLLVRAGSVDWELRSLRVIKDAVLNQLARYPVQDNANNDEEEEVGDMDNKLAAWAVVRSEREVCLYWLGLCRLTISLLQLASADIDQYQLLAAKQQQASKATIAIANRALELLDSGWLDNSDPDSNAINITCLLLKIPKALRERSDLDLAVEEECEIAIGKHSEALHSYLMVVIRPLLVEAIPMDH